MTLKPIDFLGIAVLNQSLVDQLNHTLEEQESRLALTIKDSIRPHDISKPELSGQNGFLSLSESVHFFAKQCAITPPLQEEKTHKSMDWKHIAKEVNEGLWKYVEALESGVTELFQQLDQVNIEDWHSDLPHVVTQIKEMLTHRIEDLIWAIRRLEKHLKDYRKQHDSTWGHKIFVWKSIIDNELLINLSKSQKCLQAGFESFVRRYRAFQELKGRVESSIHKFSGYQVFGTLEIEAKMRLQELYDWLKLWELNQKRKKIPDAELIRAVHQVIGQERALAIFRHYYKALSEALFDRSRLLKQSPLELIAGSPGRSVTLEAILGYRIELHTLGALVQSFRDFLLNTDANPYVRARLGFGEWTVGPEPETPKQLLRLGYEIEELDKLFLKFRETVEQSPTKWNQQENRSTSLEVERILHEMGQPLTSRSLMQSKAERILQQIDQLNELGSPSPLVVPFIGQVLSKAMRADWQHQVLQEFTDFHRIYDIHSGIVDSVGMESSHYKRLKRFQAIIKQVEQWVRSRTINKHAHEIEQDMNDMKELLQDFFAQVQRVVPQEDLAVESATIDGLAHQLLEYRYLFGCFFYYLRKSEEEGKGLRHRFLFVDQYFESIESRLHEMRQKVS